MIKQLRADVRIIREHILIKIAESQGEAIRFEDLAECLECHPNTVKNNKKALEKLGLITSELAYSTQRGRAGNTYQLTEAGKKYIEAKYGTESKPI